MSSALLRRPPRPDCGHISADFADLQQPSLRDIGEIRAITSQQQISALDRHCSMPRYLDVLPIVFLGH